MNSVFRKSWKKIILGFAAFFWNSCGEDAQVAVPQTDEGNISNVQPESSATGTIALYGVPVYDLSSSSISGSCSTPIIESSSSVISQSSSSAPTCDVIDIYSCDIIDSSDQLDEEVIEYLKKLADDVKMNYEEYTLPSLNPDNKNDGPLPTDFNACLDSALSQAHLNVPLPKTLDCHGKKTIYELFTTTADKIYQRAKKNIRDCNDFESDFYRGGQIALYGSPWWLSGNGSCYNSPDGSIKCSNEKIYKYSECNPLAVQKEFSDAVKSFSVKPDNCEIKEFVCEESVVLDNTTGNQVKTQECFNKIICPNESENTEDTDL